MIDQANVSRLFASTTLRRFGFGERLQATELAAWKQQLATLFDHLLSESRLDTAVAAASLRLLDRYHLFMNRLLPLSELQQVVFTAFMLAAKIVAPRIRVPWVSMGARMVEGHSVLWLEKAFLIDIRWDDDMLVIVQEVWRAYDEARGAVHHSRGPGIIHVRYRGESGWLKPTLDRLSRSSSMTSFSLSPAFGTPLLLAPLKPRRVVSDGNPRPLTTTTTRAAGAGAPLIQTLRPANLAPGRDKTATLHHRLSLDALKLRAGQMGPVPHLRSRVSQIFRRDSG